MEFAERHGGAIVNTDSMQVYSVLRTLTARPGPEDLGRARHLLYGHVHPSIAFSTGAWLRDVMALSGNDEIDTGRPVFVGGTGLYFRALIGGISEMPEIPHQVRERWRYELAQQGPTKLHAILMRQDSAAAMSVRPTDGQRIVRALEVLQTSGRSILAWQADRGCPLIDIATARMLVVETGRDDLVARIDARFDRMIGRGALEEVKALAALRLDPTLPAMKAIGVRELEAAMTGETTLEEAVALAKIATRQYAKRQTTWFRHQLGPHWQRIGSDARISDITL